MSLILYLCLRFASLAKNDDVTLYIISETKTIYLERLPNRPSRSWKLVYFNHIPAFTESKPKINERKNEKETES